jgi:hypothetical protein
MKNEIGNDVFNMSILSNYDFQPYPHAIIRSGAPTDRKSKSKLTFDSTFGGPENNRMTRNISAPNTLPFGSAQSSFPGEKRPLKFRQ